jgi:hypothetical protein
MAIDTATKRAAALGAGLTPGVILPVADDSIDAADRSQLASAPFGAGGTEVERQVIDVNGGEIPVKTSAEVLYLRFDWTGVLDDGVTLSSVAHTVPGGAVEEAEATNGDGTSDLNISGGTHAALYQLTIVATLSNSQTVSRTWPLRIYNS